MLKASNIEQTPGGQVAVSEKMATAIDLWAKLFLGKAPWLSKDVQSMNLPASIASEMARLVTLEMKSEITGSPRAKYLDEQYRLVVAGLRRYCEYGCAKGGLVMKPYVDGTAIAVDYVQADAFFPLSFNSRGDVTAAVMPEQITVGEWEYMRLERHELSGTVYTITNTAYKRHKDAGNGLGAPCPLSALPEWAGLAPSLTIKNVERPLFAYFRMPTANNIDPASPLGVSVYSRAVQQIQQADEQYSRLLWEFEGSELAIDASQDALKCYESGDIAMPKHTDRLFRRSSLEEGAKDFYQVFSPAIRDQSQINGLNAILRKVEFLCELAYGTLSDVQDVDKTAEEIKASKQRSFSTVSDTQKALEKTLRDLAYAMDVWATVGNLAPRGKYDQSFDWDDSLVTDRGTEFAQRQQLAGFGRSEAQKAVWAGKKNTLTNAVGQPIIKVSKTTITGEPNTITQKENAKGGIDRNFYGPDGKQVKQTSNHDHGHKAESQFGNHGEHGHDYDWDGDGELHRGPARELTDDERKENGDIL